MHKRRAASNLLNIWVFYRTLVCPGGYAFHKKLDGPGVALAILYWFVAVVIVIGFGAVLVMAFGAEGNPELQQKLREFMEQARAATP